MDYEQTDMTDNKTIPGDIFDLNDRN